MPFHKSWYSSKRVVDGQDVAKRLKEKRNDKQTRIINERDRLMGHASLAMTMRYAHLSQRHEADAVAKLDSKLAENRNTFENEEAELIEMPDKLAASGLYVT